MQRVDKRKKDYKKHLLLYHKRMKIGVDIRSAGGFKAGKGWHAFRITRHLLKLDKKNQYILYTNAAIAGFEEFKNVEMRIVEQRGLFWHRTVAKDILESELDYFFAPSSYIIPALLPKSTKPGAPKTIIIVYDLIAILFKKMHLKKAVLIEKLFIKKALKKATHLVCISEHTKKDLLEFMDIPEEKIALAYPASSSNFYPTEKGLEEFRNKTSLPKKFFLSLGTIEPRKNYETLVQAFAMIHEKYPEHHLIIVGKKGWGSSYEELDKLVRENYLQKYVHILGYLTNRTINSLYNLATAFVFPTHYEGFGLPPLEAMQAGCPVIVSDNSALPEVVGEAGLYCDSEKPGEFAEAMEKLIKDENLREQLINKGRIQSKKFSWEDSAQKILNLFT